MSNNMNSEEERLRTFFSWPVNAPVYTRQLAIFGFFATGNFLEAECNWCHCRISDWEYGDEVHQRHFDASPQCEFLTNSYNCGNISMSPERAIDLLNSNSTGASGTDNTSTTATDRQPVDLMIESNRLATFKNWPNPNISPQSLAKAGFFYLNRSDEVKCAWCQGVIAQWEKQDNAFDEHRRFFPNCPRVQLGPLIEIASDGIRDLGIQHISPPKNPRFSSLDARLRTYTNWPIPNIQKPDALAHAGLYYQEVDDQVRCFHCNMGLRSWEKEDDPWFEHAKWFPMCQFVRLAKGVNYIKEVQELAGTTGPPENPFVPVMTIDEAMTTAPVRLALEMGVDGGAIRNETQRQIILTGSPYATIDDLLKAVFDKRENTEEQNNRDGIQYSYGSDCTGVVNNGTTTADMGSNTTSIVHGGNSITTSCCESDIRKDRGSNESKSEQNVGEPRQKTLNGSTPLSQENLSAESVSLEEENRKLKDARLCKVCLDEEVGVVYLPCGHLVTCVQCAPGVNQCPMCRTTIKGFVRTFLS